MASFVVLDLETTGVDPRRDRIIEVAALHLEDGMITHRFESLVNPRVPIPYEITLLTGLREEDFKDAPTIDKLVPEITAFVGKLPIVGHNIAFDTGFLRAAGVELQNAELDTLMLARILLAKEASYALEVLMKKYELPEIASHRAMADVETTTAFFLFLERKINELPRGVIDEIISVLKKISWPGEILFEDARKIDEHKSAVAKPDKAFPTADVRQKIKDGKVIAYGSPTTRTRLLAQCAEKNLTVAELQAPHLYLSPKKLHAYQSREKLTLEEAAFISKIYVWLDQTQSGARHELSLDRGEFSLFDLVCDKEKKDIFWEKALREAVQAQLVLIHHGSMTEELTGLPEEIHERTLLITDTHLLEDTLTTAQRIKYTESRLRPIFGEKATLAFGLLGIFYEKFSEPGYGGYLGNVIMDEAKQTSIEWQHFIQALRNLPDNPDRELMLAACAHDPQRVQWISSFADEIAFHSAPREVGGIFAAAVSAFRAVTIDSSTLYGTSGIAFIKKLFGLGDDSRFEEEPELLAQKLAPPTAQVVIPEKFPEPYSGGYFKKCVELFNEIIKEKKGRTLFLLSSKKSVEAIYAALLPIKPESVRLLAVGPSGGTGKTCALFMENPASCVLFSTAQILPHLEELKEMLEVIVIQKIPFDPPDDPICSARAAQFEKGFEQYSLPRAVMKFRAIIDECMRTPHLEKIYILDSRIRSRGYGNLFFT